MSSGLSSGFCSEADREGAGKEMHALGWDWAQGSWGCGLLSVLELPLLRLVA